MYIPKLPKLAKLEINSASIDLILYFYLKVFKENPGINIIPAGISFGGGLLLKAISELNEKKYIPKSILTYGTFYSLESTIKFLISGEIVHNGKNKYIKPHDWGMTVLFHNFLSRLDLGFNTTELQKILKLRVNNKISESEIEIDKLPKNQKQLLVDIFSSNQTTEIKMIVEQMIELYQNELENISPVNICDKINCKVFLMHGGNDSMVPYIESINLNENLKNSQLFISGLYEHREIQKVNSILKKINEFKLMSNFFSDFIDHNGN